MAVNVLFISEQYIKDTSYIDENVDANLLRSNILETQDIRIRRIIGTGLYNELKTQINGNTLTALNTTLLDDYVSPALKYWVLNDGAFILQYKIMNKGIVTRQSENTTSVGVTEFDRLVSFFKDRAEYYSQRVTDYLIEHNLEYPLYNNPGNGYDIEHPNNNNYTQGWHLGDDLHIPKGIDIDYGRNRNC